MQNSIKSVLKYVLIFQIALGPFAKADLSFDFGDDGSVVTPGDDHDHGYEDGNCVGSGCGESDGRGDYDDDGDQSQHDSHDQHQGDDQGAGSRQDRDYETYQKPDSAINDPGNPREITKQDTADHWGGFYVKDDQGKFYNRDEGRPEIYQERASGKLYVKDIYEEKLLPLNGLKYCVASLDCDWRFGYKSEYWNYPYDPEFKNETEANAFHSNIRFAEKQSEIQSDLSRASSEYRNHPDKKIIVEHARNLFYGASKEFKSSPGSQRALELQKGAYELLETLTEIAIGVSPVGWAKDAYELITGTNALTGKQLSNTERFLAGVGVALATTGLGYAGFKIIKGMKEANKAARDGERIAAALEKLGEIGIARFKDGTNKTAITLIGREMTSVNAAADAMKSAGVEVKTFQSSRGAFDKLKKAGLAYPGSHVPYDKIPNTEIYRENMKWVDEMISADHPVIDLGNPKNIPERSRFWDDEVLKFFGEENKL